MARTVHLHVPISEEEILSLQLDDIVYITGVAYSMLYEDHYTLLMDMIKSEETLPMRLDGGVIYNTGTIYRKKPSEGYELYALGATTSSKFNAQTPDFIRVTGIRAIIGKGGMDKATLESMKENGCVYLAISGGCSAIYTPAAELVEDYWPELMPVDNQRLKFQLTEFGPLFVSMDAHGNSIYQQCAESVQSNLSTIYDKLNIKRK